MRGVANTRTSRPTGNRGGYSRTQPLVLTILAALALCLAAGPTPASAGLYHPKLSACSFGSDGTSGSSISANRLAFQQATGRLYAAKSGSPSGIFGFDASTLCPPAYPLLSGFGPLATPELNSNSTDIAVDNTALPSAGNIYVVGGGSIRGYRPDGTQLSSSTGSPNFPIAKISESDGKPHEWTAVAVDPSGNLWAAEAQREIHEYSPTGVELDKIDTSAFHSLGQFPRSLDFDSGGDLYVGSSAGVWKLPPPAYDAPVEIDPQPTSGNVTVDRSTGDLFVAYEKTIDRYSSAGNLIERLPNPPLFGGSKFQGIAIDEATKDLYAFLEEEGGKIVAFQALPLPDPATASPSDLTDTSLTLNGSVDPAGSPLTGCQFEYLTEAEFANRANEVQTFAIPHIATGTGDESGAHGTGDLESGSNEVKNLSTAFGTFAVGQQISASGIPSETTVTAVSGATLELSKAATATKSATELSAGSKTITNVSTATGAFVVGAEIQSNFTAGKTIITAVEPGKLQLSKPTFNTGTSVPLEAVPAGGTYTLTFAGQTTGATATGDLAAGSTVVENTATATGAIIPGETISGAKIPAGTTVASVDQVAHKLTLSAAVEAGGTAIGVSLASNLAFRSNATIIQKALQALSSIGPSGALVSGAGLLIPGVISEPFKVEFTRSLAETDVPQLTADTSALIPPGVTAALATTTQGSGWGSANVAPCSPAFGSISPGGGSQAVSATISGLSPGGAYRYRLSASNANGTNPSKALAITLAQPNVETVGSPIRSATTARLDSRLDPHGLATDYHFEYIDDAAYQANLGASQPSFAGAETTPSHSAGSGGEVELVSQLIEKLSPATTYHYRVVADNGSFGGAIAGAESTLTTRASDAPLRHGRFPGPPGSDRAWEQVNLPDTSGNPIAGAAGISSDGERALYQVTGGTSISQTGTLYNYLFAHRPPGEHPAEGWQTDAVYPSRSAVTFASWLPPAADGDLSQLLELNLDFAAAGGTGAAVWRIPTVGGTPTKLYQVAPGRYGNLAVFSDDGSRVLLVLVGAGIDPDHGSPPGGVSQLYDVSSGTPQMISLLPGAGKGAPGPSCGVSAGAFDIFHLPANSASRTTHWISQDGSRAFFPSAGNEPCGAIHLYMRDFAAEATTQVDGPLPSPPLSGPTGPECSGTMIRSTSSSVYFWTQSRLVESDTAISGGCGGKAGGDVYRYDLAGQGFECLTCVAPGGRAANVAVGQGAPEGAGSQIAVAADGSRLYFTTTSHLLPGAPEAGTPAIYRVNAETHQLAYIGPLDPGDLIGENPDKATAMTPDGRFLVFRSAAAGLNQLTDSNNGNTKQDYIYDDAERSLLCATCPPDGSAPRGASAAGIAPDGGEQEAGPNLTSLADNGDFAFATPTPLAAADQNTAPAGRDPRIGEDVYEWRDGRALLVSDGLTNWPSQNVVPHVATISPSGRDLFFTEAAQLTPDALDGYTRLYDARIGGGIEFPEEQKPCPLEVCQGTPKGAPEEAEPGTSSFSGPGNVKEGNATKPRCAKGKVRRKGRCVAKKHKRAKRAAKHDRGNAR